MRIFLMIREHFAMVGIHPRNAAKMYSQIFKNAMVLICYIECFMATFTFFVYKATTYRDYVECFYGWVTLFLNICNFLIIIWKMEKIFELITDFEKAIEKRLNNPVSRVFYQEANRKMDTWSRIYGYIALKLTPILIHIPYLVSSYSLYFWAGRGAESFKLPFLASLPYDWRTPIGYPVALLNTCWAVFYILMDCYCILSYIVGSFWMLMAFAQDIHQEIITLNNLNKRGGNRVKLQEKLSGIIQLHVTAKQLFNEFMRIMEFLLTTYFLWSVVTICNGFLEIQVELVESFFHTIGYGNLLGSIMPVILLTWSFFQIFVFCDFGEQLTSQFDELYQAIYKCGWYSFPLKFQKMLPMMLMCTQESMILQGFGNVRCSCESFKKVVNGGFSYFMVLRQFDK